MKATMPDIATDIFRPHHATHPWIKFAFNINEVTPRLWMLLGEARSKCEHIKGTPLRPTVADTLHALFLAKGALATTAIEGNTLTEQEVLDHLAGRLKLPPSRQYLVQEIDNIIEALNSIEGAVRRGHGDQLTVSMIKGFNKHVLRNLPLEAGVVPGEFRAHQVTVGNIYRPVTPEDCAPLTKQVCEWLNGAAFRPTKEQPEMKFIGAVLRAILAHLYVAWIHPFGDGNGRTARLVEFQVLLAAGLPTPAAHLLSNHYNQTRTDYYRQLKAASDSGGNVIPFIEYAVTGFVEGLREQLTFIRFQQWDIVWRNYVHEKFREEKGKSDQRRRHLVLDLSTLPAPVPRGKLREVSPRVAREYAGKTDKTLSRDLNALERMGLVRRQPDGYVPARDAILSFLPIIPLKSKGAAEAVGLAHDLG